MLPITSLYRSFCVRSGVRNATSAAPLTASAGSATCSPSFFAFAQLAPRLAHADDDVEAAVLQIQRMCATLAAVAEDGDARALEGLLVDVLLRIDLHVRS